MYTKPYIQIKLTTLCNKKQQQRLLGEQFKYFHEACGGTKADAWHISVIPEQEGCLEEITQHVIWTTACQMTKDAHAPIHKEDT